MDNKKYWFPAKKYGWGWGLPSSWQGWLIFILYILLVSSVHIFIDPALNIAGYLGLVLSASALLFIVAYLKGEPPKWRWGNKD